MNIKIIIFVFFSILLLECKNDEQDNPKNNDYNFYNGNSNNKDILPQVKQEDLSKQNHKNQNDKDIKSNVNNIITSTEQIKVKRIDDPNQITEKKNPNPIKENIEQNKRNIQIKENIELLKKILSYSERTSGLIASVDRFLKQQNAQTIIQLFNNYINNKQINYSETFLEEFLIVRDNWIKLINEYNEIYNKITALQEFQTKNNFYERLFITVLKKHNLNDLKSCEKIHLNELTNFYNDLSESIQKFNKFEEDLYEKKKTILEIIQKHNIGISFILKNKILDKIKVLFNIYENELNLEIAINNLIKYIQTSESYNITLESLDKLINFINELKVEFDDEIQELYYYFNEIRKICLFKLSKFDNSTINNYLSQTNHKKYGIDNIDWNSFFYSASKNIDAESLKNIENSFFQKNKLVYITKEQKKVLKNIYLFLKDLTQNLNSNKLIYSNYIRITKFLDTIHQMNDKDIEFAINSYLNPDEKYILILGKIDNNTESWHNIFINQQNINFLDFSTYNKIILKDFSQISKDCYAYFDIIANILEKIAFCKDFETNIKNLIKLIEHNITNLLSSDYVGSILDLKSISENNITNFGKSFKSTKDLEGLVKKYIKLGILNEKTIKIQSKEVNLNGEDSILTYIVNKLKLEEKNLELYAFFEKINKIEEYKKLYIDLNYLYDGLKFSFNELILEQSKFSEKIENYINLKKSTSINIEEIIQYFLNENINDKQKQDLINFYSVSEYIYSENINILRNKIINSLICYIEYKKDFTQLGNNLTNLLIKIYDIEPSDLRNFETYINQDFKYDYDKNKKFTNIFDKKNLRNEIGAKFDNIIDGGGKLGDFLGKLRDKTFDIYNLFEPKEINFILKKDKYMCDISYILSGIETKDEFLNIKYKKLDLQYFIKTFELI